MNFPIPNVIDSTLQEAIDRGCDCVMLKMDGFPVSINCATHHLNVFSQIPFLEKELIYTTQLIEPLDALLIGAKSPRADTIWLYDTWWVKGQDVQNLPYRNRYVLTRTNAKALDERFKVVTVLPISSAQELWREVVLDPDNIKGLVFRRSKDTAAGDLYVKRYYKETPEGLT
jgi:hypothetical protein